MSTEGKHQKDSLFKTFRTNFIKSIKSSDKVFIVGHNEPDFDAIGSAIGIRAIAKHFNKEAYIIVDDDALSLEPGVKKIIDNYRDKYNIITLADARVLMGDKSLLVVTDTNKDYMVSVKDDLDKFNDIFVVDHHETDQHTIKGQSYINTDVSSASEIIAHLMIIENIKINSNVASYLLSGIVLDTRRFKQNTSPKTHDIAEKLLNRGADTDYVNDLFKEEFASFCKINNLIINGTIFKQYAEETLIPRRVSFTLNREAPATVYRKEEIAKAADRMLKFSVDASFVIGYNKDGNISISARSLKKPQTAFPLIGQIEAGEILQKLDANHCGGNAFSAGGIIPSEDEISIFDIEKRLMDIVEQELSPNKEEEHQKVLKLERNA